MQSRLTWGVTGPRDVDEGGGYARDAAGYQRAGGARVKSERAEERERNEEERRKRKKESDKKWRERKNRGGQAKLLRPIPKAMLMRSGLSPKQFVA